MELVARVASWGSEDLPIQERRFFGAYISRKMTKVWARTILICEKRIFAHAFM